MASKIPIPTTYGDLMTIEQFAENVNDGLFTDYDGVGYYSNGETYEYENIVSISSLRNTPNRNLSKLLGFSHVIWFNR